MDRVNKNQSDNIQQNDNQKIPNTKSKAKEWIVGENGQEA